MFSQVIASTSEADYVVREHKKTIETAIAQNNSDWAATMAKASPYAVHRGSVSLIRGASPSWREQFYAHKAKKAYIFGEKSLPDHDFEILQKHGITCPIIPEAGHSMGLENPEGLAKEIARTTE